MNTSKMFYIELTRLAFPIILQNLLSSAIGSLDTLMLNSLGQTPLSAVSLANQLFFVLNLFFIGLTGSVASMISQYLGKNNTEKAYQLFTIACKVSMIVCVAFSMLAVLTPVHVMYLLTNESELIEIGSTYLRITGISYLFLGFSQTYLTLLKSMKETKKSMVISTITLLVNFVLNAGFIFGLWGLPKLDVKGVAIATCIARALELMICIVDMFLKKTIAVFIKTDCILWKDFFKISLPMTLQGFVWGGAMAVMSAIMGHMGSDAVAANSVASSIQNIATVVSFGLASAGSILLGNDLGRNEFDIAKQHASALMRAVISCGIAACLLMLFAENSVIALLSLTTNSKKYLSIMYKILSVNVIFAAITNTILCGVFTAGGDTKYGLYIDGIVMWSLVIAGSFASFALKWNPIWVFVVLNVDELLKTPFVIKKYYQWDWVKNITREAEE